MRQFAWQMPKKSSTSWWRDRFLGYHVLQAAYALSLWCRWLVPGINRMAYRVLYDRRVETVDVSHHVFNFDCLFQQYVDEWAVPRDRAAEALRRLDQVIESKGYTAHFPVEVRFVARDEFWLSPCYGQESVFIGIIAYRPYGFRVEHERYFADYESVMRACGGRPHWAKAHGVVAREFANMYPRFGEFCSLRSQLDPAGLFMNAYLMRCLQDTSNLSAAYVPV
jgi:L-gulonolactone oxidase